MKFAEVETASKAISKAYTNRIVISSSKLDAFSSIEATGSRIRTMMSSFSMGTFVSVYQLGGGNVSAYLQGRLHVSVGASRKQYGSAITMTIFDSHAEARIIRKNNDSLPVNEESLETDEERFGGPGIDTEHERDLLNYRPKIKYEKENRETTYDKTGLPNEEALKELRSISITEIWTTLRDTMEEIEKVEQSIVERISGLETIIPKHYKESIQQAAEKLHFSVQDSIPFELYKKTFMYQGSPEGKLIQDIYEDYQADVHGHLDAELYADVIEIKEDWESMIEFTKKALLSQIVPASDLPTTLNDADEKLEYIREKEQEMIEHYTDFLRLAQINEEILDNLRVSEYGSERYYQVLSQTKEDEKRVMRMKRRLQTKAEITDLINRKVLNARDNIELIDHTVGFNPYKDEEYELLLHLLRQQVGKENFTKGLRKVQLMLKLSVDKKKDQVNLQKEELRGLAGRDMRNKINHNLINGVHLRNEIFSDVHELMEYFDGIPRTDSFDNMAGHIVEGLEKADEMYKGQSMDFYKIHTMESGVRSEKLTRLIDKDAAREVYKMIDGILDYMEQTGSQPNEGNLVEWLNGYIEQ